MVRPLVESASLSSGEETRESAPDSNALALVLEQEAQAVLEATASETKTVETASEISQDVPPAVESAQLASSVEQKFESAPDSNALAQALEQEAQAVLEATASEAKTAETASEISQDVPPAVESTPLGSSVEHTAQASEQNFESTTDSSVLALALEQEAQAVLEATASETKTAETAHEISQNVAPPVESAPLGSSVEHTAQASEQKFESAPDAHVVALVLETTTSEPKAAEATSEISQDRAQPADSASPGSPVEAADSALAQELEQKAQAELDAVTPDAKPTETAEEASQAPLEARVESAPPSSPLESPDSARTQAFEATTPEPIPASSASQLSPALESEAQLLPDSNSQLLEAERAGIGAILASFSTRPARCLLGAPLKVVRPPAPRSAEWIKTPRPKIPAIAPTDPSIVSLTQGPQTPTLNGPSLPPELRCHTEGPPSQPEPSRKRTGPPWMVSFLIATGLVLGAVSVMQYINANRDAQPPPAASTQPGQTPRAASADSALEEHPLARFVEVSGVRITAGANHKPQLQYIVVNHSAKELTGLGIRLALRSASDSASGTPLFTVVSKVPALGAYQSREIRTDLDADLRVTSLPEWQSLRSEVQVTGH